MYFKLGPKIFDFNEYKDIVKYLQMCDVDAEIVFPRDDFLDLLDIVFDMGENSGLQENFHQTVMEREDEDDIDDVRAEAEEIGREMGYEEGYDNGFSEGRDTGYNDGYEEGYKECLEEHDIRPDY
jgi:hypothetical protein